MIYNAIIDSLIENADKDYAKPDKIADAYQRTNMINLKESMRKTAQLFENLVENSLKRIPNTKLVFSNPSGIRYLDGSAAKIRNYLWIQLKEERWKENSISISIFATKEFFRITTEFVDKDVTTEEKDKYNKIFDTPLNGSEFDYFFPKENRYCTYNEVIEKNKEYKFQISKSIKRNEISSDEQLEVKIAESILFLTPIYQGILTGNIPIVENINSQNLTKESTNQLQNQQETVVMQKIFFGAPGTGKSHKIDHDLFKDENGNPVGKGIKKIPEVRKFRTTFHPDYDYAQFIGAYKPKKVDNTITYSFVPQVFAKAYAAAWKQYFAAGNTSTADNQVYLVIEEINRGNCAQIFGDIFQLLDRDDSGASQYSIDADCDFAEWLDKEFKAANLWDAYKKEVGGEGKLKLPPNLNILATMNTSDQSLFPMDSAFKRRFDWEYVPINYEKAEADFIVGDASFNFKWLEFLKKVNADIYKVTQSEDKQMGEFFIKPKNKDYITLDEFRSKVLFYLWDSVYKDELDSKLVFHFAYPEKGPDVTFQRLFNSDFVEILEEMLANLDDKYKDGAQQG